MGQYGYSMATYLTIVKRPSDGQARDVIVRHCGDLSLLNRGNLPLGKHDKGGYVLLPSQAVDSSGAGITSGGTNKGEMMSIC